MTTRLTIALLIGAALTPLALAQDSEPEGQDHSIGAPQPLEQEADAPAEAAVPFADQIIARHIEARGGEEAIRKNRSILMSGTYEWPMQAQVSGIVIKRLAPDRVWLELTDHMVRGRRVACYDGEFAWEYDDVLGAQPSVAPDETNSFNYDYFWDLNYAEHYESIRTIDRTQFDDRDAHRVRVVDLAGQERFHFFDIETGLRIGEQQSTSTPQGTVTITTVYKDWEKIDGVMVHTTEMTFRSQPGMNRQLVGIAEFDEVEFNAIDQSDFKMPPEVYTALKPMIDEARRQRGEGEQAPPEDAPDADSDPQPDENR